MGLKFYSDDLAMRGEQWEHPRPVALDGRSAAVNEDDWMAALAMYFVVHA
jgi:hypothetical protein